MKREELERAGMSVLAIDPGTERSAYVVFDGERIESHGIVDNEALIDRLRDGNDENGFDKQRHLAIEMVQCFGMAVGHDVLETVFWIGKFCHAFCGPHERIFRTDVKMHLCQQTKGVNDSVIRQALIDRFGPGKDKAVGTVKAPGPLHGIKSHEWQALAVAVTWWDKHRVTVSEVSDDQV